MSETTVTVIEKVTSKEGAKNGKPWKKYAAVTPDGFYSTFDKSVADIAAEMIGERVEIFWKPSGDENQFKDMLSVKRAGASGTADGIPTTRTEQGTADWDLIGLRKTRCLLWAHYLGSPLATHVAAKAATNDASSGVYRFGSHLITMAERDIYWREPAAQDEDVPF